MINERNSDCSQEQILMKLNIDIGKNKKEILRIYQSEDIQDKIDLFCKKYKLSASKNLQILNQVMSQISNELNEIRASTFDNLQNSNLKDISNQEKEIPPHHNTLSYSTNNEVYCHKVGISPERTFKKYQSSLFSSEKGSPLIYHKPLSKKNNSAIVTQDNNKSLDEQIITRLSVNESSIKDFKTGRPLFKSNKSRSKEKVKKGINTKISRETVLKMKIVKYKEIFSMLDSDCDGYISSKNIKLSVLEQDLLVALTPIFEDLQKNDTKMNFKEFCIKADRYLTVKILPFT